jgi:hypothetical protein
MSQIKKKGIEDNAIDGAKFRLLAEQTLRSRNSTGTADVDILKVDSSDNVVLMKVPMADASLPMPSAGKEFATIEWIEAYIQGKTDAKDAVQACATGPVALTGAGELVVDDYGMGVATATPVARVLLPFQADPKDNGIYDYTYAAGNYTLTRSSDFDEDTEVTNGAYTVVVNGTVYQGYQAVLVSQDPIVVGTSDLNFAAMPTTAAMAAADMLKRVGNDFSVDLATVSGLESTDPGVETGQLRVRADNAALEKDKSTKLDSATNAVVSKRSRREQFTLGAGDISNGYIDLAHVATQGSVTLGVVGFGTQYEGIDFTVNYTGGSGSNTRVTLAGGLAVGGTSALVAGDKVQVDYESF